MNEIQFEREKESLQTEYLLKSAVLQSLERDLAAFDAVGTAQSAPEELKKMDQAFARGVKSGIKNVKKASKTRQLFKRIGAAVAVLLLVLIPSRIYVNASIREAVANYLISNFSQFSTVKYDSNNYVCPPFGWDLTYYPQAIPKGFEYEEISLSDLSGTIWYKNQFGNFFSFTVFSTSADTSFNTENMEATEIEIGKYPAVLYMSEDGVENELAIYLPEVFLLINGNLTKEELMEIANNINGL